MAHEPSQCRRHEDVKARERRYRIPRQAQHQTSAAPRRDDRLSGTDGDVVEHAFASGPDQRGLDEVVIADRDAARKNEDVGGQPVRDQRVERLALVLRDPEIARIDPQGSKLCQQHRRIRVAHLMGGGHATGGDDLIPR